MEGYTYQCDVLDTKMIMLYNNENMHTYDRYANKDGSRVSSDILLGRVRLIEQDNWTRRECGDISVKFFSPQERERVNGNEYTISMIVDSDTGEVKEVNFTLFDSDPFTTIPVSTFRQIELELKDKIWFTPTSEAKKLKFIRRSWRQKVDGD